MQNAVRAVSVQWSAPDSPFHLPRGKVAFGGYKEVGVSEFGDARVQKGAHGAFQRMQVGQ